MNFFKGSWMTTLAGWVVAVFAVVQQVLSEHPIPSTPQEWVSFIGLIITGIGITLAKDANKSNAPNPVAEPVLVTKPDL